MPRASNFNGLTCQTLPIAQLDPQGLFSALSNLIAPKDLTAERLRQLLTYDPMAGDFRWLVATNRRIRIGDIAGTMMLDEGYRLIGIDGAQYRAHRLAYLYMTGAFPDAEVDHVDMDRGNNAWSNLREANQSLNNANRRRLRNNASGFKGVSNASGCVGRWSARVQVNGRKIHLGTFDTPQAAHAAYVAAAIQHFGPFARAA